MISLADQIAEAQRELALRKRLYPGSASYPQFLF